MFSVWWLNGANNGWTAFWCVCFNHFFASSSPSVQQRKQTYGHCAVSVYVLNIQLVCGGRLNKGMEEMKGKKRRKRNSHCTHVFNRFVVHCFGGRTFISNISLHPRGLGSLKKDLISCDGVISFVNEPTSNRNSLHNAAVSRSEDWKRMKYDWFVIDEPAMSKMGFFNYPKRAIGHSSPTPYNFKIHFSS